MTVMCVIYRELYITRHYGCGYLLNLIREAPLAAGSTMAPLPCSHSPLSLAKTFASQLDCIGRCCNL